MSKSLAMALTLTDLGFLAYWMLTAFYALKFIDLPPELLFSNYHDPRVVGWNWSFAPLDLAFSLTGLYAVRLAAKDIPAWRPWALVSLTLSSTAGLMAISYWIIMGEFDPAWFGLNMALFVWPLIFIPGIINDLSQHPE